MRGLLKEDLEALRLNAARSIKPGWDSVLLKDWRGKRDKPNVKHLRQAAMERNPSVPNLRSAQVYVDWLAANAPKEGAPIGTHQLSFVRSPESSKNSSGSSKGGKLTTETTAVEKDILAVKATKVAIERDDAMGALTAKYEEATQMLRTYEEGPNGVMGSFLHTLKKRRVQDLEGVLQEMMGGSSPDLPTPKSPSAQGASPPPPSGQGSPPPSGQGAAPPSGQGVPVPPPSGQGGSSILTELSV